MVVLRPETGKRTVSCMVEMDVEANQSVLSTYGSFHVKKRPSPKTRSSLISSTKGNNVQTEYAALMVDVACKHISVAVEFATHS
jgi:hypothetical protein